MESVLDPWINIVCSMTSMKVVVLLKKRLVKAGLNIAINVRKFEVVIFMKIVKVIAAVSIYSSD